MALDWRVTEKLYTQKEMDDQRDFFKFQVIVVLEQFQVKEANEFDNLFSVCMELDIDPENIQIADTHPNNILEFLRYLECGSAFNYLENRFGKELDDYVCEPDFDSYDSSGNRFAQKRYEYMLSERWYRKNA